MALTTVDTNNKLVKYTKEINREFVRENLFSPYMSEDMNAIIRVRQELKAGGDTINIPFVKRLKGAGIGSGTLVGAEEKIDNYGMRAKVDWARNAVVTNNAEEQKDSADLFGEAKPLLSDWGKSRQRDDMIKALMAFPSETLPAADVTVNGTLYGATEAAQTAAATAWMTANTDRIQYGAARTNTKATHILSLAELDTTNDKLTAANLALLKRVALNADPHIRPYKTADGYEYYVAFCGTNTFRDLKLDLQTVNKDARPRDVGKNPIFQDGDQIYDGVIVRQIPEISNFVTSSWTGLTTAGASSARVEPVFLCGQQAAAMLWGRMAKPTFRKEDDYQFLSGVGIEMCFGTVKMYSKHPMTGSNLVQSGVVTGFYASAAD